MKSIYLTLLGICGIPLVMYGALQTQFPEDPDLVFINQPSVFAGKWEKAGNSENFTDYINPKKIEETFDQTVDIVTLRNYHNTKLEKIEDDSISYRSHITFESINCFRQTITINKTYFFSGKFGTGSLVAEPIETYSKPINVSEGSVGFRKVKKVCELANVSKDSNYIKSRFLKFI